MHSLAHALYHAAILANLEGNPAEVERLASDTIELSARQNFAQFLAGGEALRGWARSASGGVEQQLVCDKISLERLVENAKLAAEVAANPPPGLVNSTPLER